jgi:hypothetical protein
MITVLRTKKGILHGMGIFNFSDVANYNLFSNNKRIGTITIFERANSAMRPWYIGKVNISKPSFSKETGGHYKPGNAFKEALDILKRKTKEQVKVTRNTRK